MRTFFLLLIAVALTGCMSSSSAPETNTYLLRADVTTPNGEQTAPIDIGLGRIALASYLTGPGIVLRTDGDRIRSARQHIWAEPLDMALRVYFRDSISAELGYPISADSSMRMAWDYRIDVYIDQLHGGLDGEATLDASWKIIDVATDKTVSTRRLQQTALQADVGYDALVDTQKVLLNQLAAAIAESLSQY